MSPGKPSPRASRTRRSRELRTEWALPRRRGSRSSSFATAAWSFFEETSRWWVATWAMKRRRWFVVWSWGHCRAKRRAAALRERGPMRTTVSTTPRARAAAADDLEFSSEPTADGDGRRVRGSRDDERTDTFGHSWNSLRRRDRSPWSMNSKPSTTTRQCAWARISKGDAPSSRLPSSRSSSAAKSSASVVTPTTCCCCCCGVTPFSAVALVPLVLLALLSSPF
mmetsp:Transcript_36330/g.116406  ORF Transcript_36330/g.116406 Transcript_36330/m.116406 type:complete len:224 (+) Transcript_36330:303-974(+)